LDNEENVAIKVAKPKAAGKMVLHSFLNEVIMLSKTNQDGNPYVISFLGICKTPKICILTELMECSLYDLLHKKKKDLICAKQY